MNIFVALIWQSWSETINEYILWLLYENLKIKQLMNIFMWKSYMKILNEIINIFIWLLYDNFEAKNK